MEVTIVNGKGFIIGRIYEIDFTCGHYDSMEALERNLGFLVPGEEVRFICPISTIRGVYARVQSLRTNQILDIDTNYIGREITEDERIERYKTTF